MVQEVSKKYYQINGGTCQIGNICKVNFTITSYMKQPIYFMYQLGNDGLI